MYRPRHSELMPSDNARGIVGGEGRFWANCRLVFTDEVALGQCRSGWMTTYRKLSGSERTRSTRIRFMRWVDAF